MKRALIAWSVALLVACMRPEERPACSPVQLAVIEANYLDEVLDACVGQDFDDCTARPEIERRYAARREAWARCR